MDYNDKLSDKIALEKCEVHYAKNYLKNANTKSRAITQVLMS